MLLIVIDTMRADRVSASGYERNTTPNLDALAAEGLRFTHAQSPRAKTTPSVASLMTGLYPHDHGVRDLTQSLRRDVPVLAERFDSAGYRTVAVVGNYVLSREISALHRGFDRWVQDFPDQVGVPPDDVPQRRATSLTDSALAELAQTEGTAEPWFFWLHYMDPHGLYDPLPEHDVFRSDTVEILPDPATLAPHPIQRGKVADYNVPPAARRPDGGVDANRVRDLYDGEVRYVDAEIGRLLAQLRERGLLDNTIVVVTADHGESLGEHRYWFEHGLYAYEATCRVPLILRLPAGHPERTAPGVRHGDISLCDLGPTLAQLADLPYGFRPQPAGAQQSPRGVSRIELVRGEDQRTHPVFSEKVERTEISRTVQTKAVRIGDWKFIRRYTHVDGPDPSGPRRLIVLSEELYDLAADPNESTDLSQTVPDAAPAARLRAELLRFFESDIDLADMANLLQRERERMATDDPETLRILEALGY